MLFRRFLIDRTERADLCFCLTGLLGGVGVVYCGDGYKTGGRGLQTSGRNKKPICYYRYTDTDIQVQVGFLWEGV